VESISQYSTGRLPSMAVVACCLKIWTEAQKIAGQNFARADP